MFTGFIKIKNTAVLLLCLFMVSCASTSLTQSWKQPELKKSFNHLMIIGISDSQQTRRIYENHFVAELKKKNISATPSYKLIDSKQKINRETVLKAVQGTEIDAVLVTYLASADSQLRHYDSPLTPGYSGSPDANMISATLITQRGRSSSSEVIGLKSDFYDVQEKSMIWSVQTRTVAPDSIDDAITEVIKLLIKELINDDILK
jgi:hypothetical protein